MENFSNDNIIRYNVRALRHVPTPFSRRVGTQTITNAKLTEGERCAPSCLRVFVVKLKPPQSGKVSSLAKILPQRHKGTKRNLCKTRSQRNQAHIIRRSAIFFADFHTLARARAAAHTCAYASVPVRLRAPPQERRGEGSDLAGNV